ncbi:YhcH/YjgK/YiaL family protein [Pedobacter sp. SD-b]|uniref:YhcH/YjgK/YiaL family protein n=1 Tax=Pedobacter segetis TaxID=2793069 RepID=A0ABS1BJ03_9SPHI|nr:YhcH/YjgK/YiaL family protein [Pedobacter segetis]MBK0382797.1 YhcH/YjgK/YiaL family protein [Pedobacter segetis]
MKKIIPLLIISLLILNGCKVHNESNNWLKKQAISTGLKPQVSHLTDQEEFAKQYRANKMVWDKAFEWMKSQDLENLAVGKYPIDGENAFASITEMVDKPFEKTGWESHKKYIDLQYIISGKEKIGVAPAATAEIIHPYNAEKDAANYKIDDAIYDIATPKEFYLFFPENAHRPSIKVNDEKVKKLVIKIRVAE